MQFFSSTLLLTYLLLGPDILLSALLSITLSVCSLLRLKDQQLHSHKTKFLDW